MITEIEINKYKILRNIKVKLQPFTVLAGPNGSGKTSFLEYISLHHGSPVYYSNNLDSITMIIKSIKHDLILIDGIDNGLHPNTQEKIIKKISNIMIENANLQIIATTYSPYLVDFMQWDEVLISGIGKDGFSKIKSITDHPDYAKWKDDMMPGEFWSMIGEDWI